MVATGANAQTKAVNDAVKAVNKAKAEADIRLEQEKVKDEMKTQMIDVSTLMASKFVALSIDEAKQNEIIDEVIKEMGDVQWLS